MSSKIKKAIFILLTFIFTLILVTEFSLRILASFPTNSSMHINDSKVGFRLRPHIQIGKNKLNKYGFNDTEHHNKAFPGYKRIAIIGDSFVYGAVDREKNFISQLSDFAKKEKNLVEFLNMGIPAAGPENYLKLIGNDALTMNCHIICVLFFIGNDITQSHEDFKTIVWLGSTREVLENPFKIGFHKEYSYLFRSFRSVSRTLRERLSDDEDQSFTKKTFLAIEYQRSEIYQKEKNNYIEKSYQASKNILMKMSDFTSKNGRELLIILAPDELQVNKSLRKQLKNAYDIDWKEYDLMQPQKILSGFLKETNINYIDLLPVFENASENKTLYIPRNTHWNEYGNKLAAIEIWKKLKPNLINSN